MNGQHPGQVVEQSGTLWPHIQADIREPSYRFGTYRATAPDNTLDRIKPLLQRAGITRLADITGLDWLGVPVYQAIRPNSRNISVALGKGVSRAQAKVSALMESLESFHAENVPQPNRRATIAGMRGALGYDPYQLPVAAAAADEVRHDLSYDPYALPLGKPTLLHDQIPIDWTPATDLSTGAATWVPTQLCQLDLSLRDTLCPPLFRATSNGLASGNTVSEAVLHGLCEVIERDSMWRAGHGQVRPERRVPRATIDAALCTRLIGRFTDHGFDVDIVDSTGPTGVACFQAFLTHAESPVTHHGAGCHPRRAVALLRALTEVAQSRLAHIAGSRDDLLRRTYEPGAMSAPAGTGTEADAGAGSSFRDIPDNRTAGWTALLHDLVGRVRTAAGASPLAVDLRRPEFGLPVVFVLAPGMRLAPPRRR